MGKKKVQLHPIAKALNEALLDQRETDRETWREELRRLEWKLTQKIITEKGQRSDGVRDVLGKLSGVQDTSYSRDCVLLILFLVSLGMNIGVLGVALGWWG